MCEDLCLPRFKIYEDTVEYLQQEERITRKMYSLHKYFKQSSVVPSSTSTYSFLSKKDIESANDSVGTAFAKKPATTSRVGLKYNTYTPGQRAEVGKYAAENGNASAARHFSKVLDFKVSESTARLKSEYLRALESRSDHVVKSLPTKPQGRPLLLRATYVYAHAHVHAVNVAVFAKFIFANNIFRSIRQI